MDWIVHYSVISLNKFVFKNVILLVKDKHSFFLTIIITFLKTNDYNLRTLLNYVQSFTMRTFIYESFTMTLTQSSKDNTIPSL